MKLRLFNLFGFIILLVLLAGGVDALGITPGRKTIEYAPGFDKEIQISVLNNDHKNMEVVLMVQGELNQSILLSEAKLEFLPSEESKPLKYKLTLPNNLEPGLHTAEILALDVPKSSGGSYVGATVAIIHQIHVYVPYPGKYADADLNILDAEENGIATFIVPVINRGKLGIANIYAIVEVYNLDYEKKARIETDFKSIEPGARIELSGKWHIDVNSGDYIAKVSVFYDGESRTFEKQFPVGDKKLTIESILVNNFQLGQIAKLQILVENRWSHNLTGVYANLFVYNHEGQVMADVKSSSEEITALAKKELIAYWDTAGVSEGEYDGKLLVRYGEKSADKNLLLKVSEDRLDITGVGYAINPRGGGGVNITTILLILVIILLIVNLAWFVFFKRFMGKKNKKK